MTSVNCRFGFVAIMLIALVFSLGPSTGQAQPADQTASGSLGIDAGPASGQPAATREISYRFLGQTLFVPLYSHIYHGDRDTPFLLSATLTVRNTDPRHSILLEAVDYYDSDGKLLRTFLPESRRLLPLAATHFMIPESDAAGGSGASFQVRWGASAPAHPPLVESVMIGTRGQQGISFTSRATVLRETVPVISR